MRASCRSPALPARAARLRARAPRAAPAPRTADGSIFNASAGYAALPGPARPRVGDPVTIVLVENTTTAKSAGSKTQRSGMGVDRPARGRSVLASSTPKALKPAAKASFNGQGNAARPVRSRSELSVTIAEVRANGTALVRGEKRMMLSQGQEWVQFSGIVRLADIDADNRIVSTRIADARIEYSGNGAVQRASREGWLSRFFNMISPF